MRTIGLEYESIIVKSDTLPANRDDMLSLWEKFARAGWELKRDPYNTEILGVKKKFSYGEIVIDNDLGNCLLEIAFPPCENIETAAQQEFEIFSILKQILGDTLSIIGIGTHPSAPYSSAEFTPKSHYPILLSNVEAMQPFALSAALQINIGGNPEDIFDEQLFLQRLSPIAIALYANAPLYKGSWQDALDIRILNYERMAVSLPTGYKDTIGIPKHHYTSWKDYFLYALNKPAILLSTNQGLWTINSKKTLLELLESQEDVLFTEIYGSPKKTQLRPLSLEDTLLQQSLIRHDARLRFALNPQADYEAGRKALLSKDPHIFHTWFQSACTNQYIEFRPLSFQRQGNTLSATAFLVGALESKLDIEKYIEHLSLDELAASRLEAARLGLKGRYGNQVIQDIVEPIVNLVLQGLKKRNLHEEQYLTPLIEQLRKKTNPALELRKIFDAGLDNVFQYITYF